jgi:hypothetical protein
VATQGPRQRIEIGTVMGNAFRTLTRNFLPFAGFALLLVGLPAFLLQYLAWEQVRNFETAVFTSYYWATVGLSWICGYLLHGIIVAIAVRDLSGRPAGVAQGVTAALARLFPMIGLSIVSGIGIALGLVLLVVPGIILMLMWMVAVPVLVEERRGVFESLGRSAELTRGSKGWIFLLLILYWGIGMLVSGAVGALTGFQLSYDESGDMLLPIIAGAIAQTLVGMLMGAMLAALYIELRQFKDGAAPDQLAAIFE